MPCSVNSSVAAARMRRLVSSAFLTMGARLQPTSQLTTSHAAPYVGSYQLDGYLEAGNAPGDTPTEHVALTTGRQGASGRAGNRWPTPAAGRCPSEEAG